MSARMQPRLLVPEVVQTSAMDCGPAALKSLFEGFRIPVSYGRLREACQTSIDGTSVDALEDVANRLGLSATQSLVPFDLAMAEPHRTLPAIAITRQGDGSTHFVVVWRRHGDWLQVMDPGTGRRWVRSNAFAASLFLHEASVPAADWRDWAGSDGFLGPLRAQLHALRVSASGAETLIAEAAADGNWFGLATLDAVIRLTLSLQRAGGLADGEDALRLCRTLFQQTMASPDDIFRLVPREYWRVFPDAARATLSERHVLIAGAVLVTVRRDARTVAVGALPEELAAAARERRPNPLAEMGRLLLTDDVASPLAIGGAIAVATLLMLVETTLLRGLIALGPMLAPGGQRLASGLALLALMALAAGVRLGIAGEALRLGRVLEVKLRMLLLDKLPRLSDRYFSSRPISDMADRGHSLHLIRAVPGIGLHFLQTGAELVLMLSALMLLDWRTGLFAMMLSAVQIAAATAVQPFIGEADLRTRTHAAALHGFSLDALLGAVPIRVHAAQRAVRRRQEALLVDWVKASRRQAGLSLVLDTAQQAVTMCLIALLLAEHAARTGGVAATDLLLVYWLMKLPVAGGTLAGLAHAYPALRNILLRLNEPLTAPEAQRSGIDVTAPPLAAPARIELVEASVAAGGHSILVDVTLSIAPGEHVAIVGPSGAGKSSLVGLLLGWHQLQSGSLSVDGMPLDGSRLEQLRTATAWVDPAVQLWNTSLAENVAYASHTTRGHVGGAISAADLDALVERLPEGLRTALGEGGARFSGGEGQRIRLARAFAQDRVRLALLDEPFRGLDRAQRLKLLTAARGHFASTTLLCVTHDIAETALFERVLVVEQGRIVEDDAPDALMRRDSRYRALAQADREAREALWAGAQWRHIHLEGGRVGPRR